MIAPICSHESAYVGLDACYCPDCNKTFQDGTAGYKQIIALPTRARRATEYSAVCGNRGDNDASGDKKIIRDLNQTDNSLREPATPVKAGLFFKPSPRDRLNGADSEHLGDRWNPAHFVQVSNTGLPGQGNLHGDVPFKSEDNGQLTLEFDCDDEPPLEYGAKKYCQPLNPTDPTLRQTNIPMKADNIFQASPPDPDDFATLLEFESAWEQWEKDSSFIIHNSQFTDSTSNELQRDNSTVSDGEELSLCKNGRAGDDSTSNELQRDNSTVSDGEELSLCKNGRAGDDSTSNELQRDNSTVSDGEELSLCKKRRHRGHGSGSISWQTITRNGKDYRQPWYQYEFWSDGKCIAKSSKYIPKKLLKRVQQLNEEKAPVREILKFLEGDKKGN